MPPAIVFAAAPLDPTPRLRATLAALDRPIVIAADGGAATALAFGFTPRLLIGDFDSLEPATLARLKAMQIRIEEYPRDKNATDGQLAVERALQEAPTELYLLGFLGGPRLDQALANILLLTQIPIPAVLLDDRNECRLLRGPGTHTWQPEPAEVISFLPVTEEVRQVTTRGLRWPLHGDTLRRADTRTVSNEPASYEVGISLEEGMLLVTRHFV